MQTAIAAQAVGQGLLARLGHQQGLEPLDVDHFVQLDEQVVAQLAQDFGLVVQAGVVLGGQGQL